MTQARDVRAPIVAVAVAMVIIVAIVGGCQFGDDAATPADGEAGTAMIANGDDGASTSIDPAATDTSDDASDNASDDASANTTGTPGLEADEEFCRAWSAFAGSFQLVAVAAAFGPGDPLELARVEIIAAPTVADAAQLLRAEFPAELADEFEIFSVGLIGPFARRAELALAALDTTGIPATDLDALRISWLDVLRQRSIDLIVPEPVLEMRLETLVDQAAGRFAAEQPFFSDDATLTSEAEVPLTLGYLQARCPDRGELGGIDVVN